MSQNGGEAENLEKRPESGNGRAVLVCQCFIVWAKNRPRDLGAGRDDETKLYGSIKAVFLFF